MIQILNIALFKASIMHMIKKLKEIAEGISAKKIPRLLSVL
jgi:hypothetical protein